MSLQMSDINKSEILHKKLKKILRAHFKADTEQLCALLDNAGKNFPAMPGEAIQKAVSQLQSLLIALHQKNRLLERKLHAQSCKLIKRNLTLKKKIEELKLSKHQVEERKAKLNSIFNAAVEGIISIDQQGRIVTVNAAVKTIFDYDEEELIGQNINKLMPIKYSKKHNSYIKNYLKTGIPKMIGGIREVEGIRKDGSSVPLDISVAEFIIDRKHFFTGILRDVSLRKRQEQNDREHLEELAHVSRLGLMGEMASGIAHEVNQPLTAISAYTQVCLDMIQSDSPNLDQIADIINKTHQQALRAGQVIYRMRDFARSRTFVRSSVDINNLIQSSITLCATDLKQHGITVRFAPAQIIPVIFIDEVQIEQVLLNMIRNSIDALTALPHPLPRMLTIRTLVNDRDDIEISIKDNGPGIAETEQGKILTPFYTNKKNGTGMGLSISRSIVEAHHGVLRFNSKPGKGSTFYFTLPSRRNPE